MEGWKTKAAGVASILSGVALIIALITGNAPAETSLAGAIGLITGGLAALGIGHKVEKAAAKIAGTK